MKTLNKRLNNRGAALVLVIIVLVVASLMVVAVAFLTQSNTMQASHQERNMQTYYIARSGAEVAYEVIFSDATVRNLINSNAFPTTPQNTNLGEGAAAVTVTRFVENGINRVRIRSVGHLTGSTQNSEVVLEFDFLDGGNLRWAQ